MNYTKDTNKSGITMKFTIEYFKHDVQTATTAIFHFPYSIRLCGIFAS